MHNHLPPELVDAARAAGAALGPAAIGATVAQAFKRGLRWTERLVQITVGICVSYFVGGAIVALYSPTPFVGQSISFVVAMIAYEATPKFIHRAADFVAAIPGELRQRLFTGKDGK